MKGIFNFLVWLLIKSKVTQKILLLSVASIFYIIYRMQHIYQQKMISLAIMISAIVLVSFIMYVMREQKT